MKDGVDFDIGGMTVIGKLQDARKNFCRFQCLSNRHVASPYRGLVLSQELSKRHCYTNSKLYNMFRK